MVSKIPRIRTARAARPRKRPRATLTPPHQSHFTHSGPCATLRALAPFPISTLSILLANIPTSAHMHPVARAPPHSQHAPYAPFSCPTHAPHTAPRYAHLLPHLLQPDCKASPARTLRTAHIARSIYTHSRTPFTLSPRPHSPPFPPPLPPTYTPHHCPPPPPHSRTHLPTQPLPP